MYGHVIVAQGSATPESGCTLTNSCTDDDTDNRSVDFDGAVHKSLKNSNRNSQKPTDNIICWKIYS